MINWHKWMMNIFPLKNLKTLANTSCVKPSVNCFHWGEHLKILLQFIDFFCFEFHFLPINNLKWRHQLSFFFLLGRQNHIFWLEESIVCCWNHIDLRSFSWFSSICLISSEHGNLGSAQHSAILNAKQCFYELLNSFLSNLSRFFNKDYYLIIYYYCNLY